MPLSPGDKLGQFDVLSLLGKGGMGEVYRARDTQLKREVALKVLPAVFSSDPDRLARFQREAELLASLDHPNIGHIHGMVQSERNWALVLALIEGPTLDDRIKQGPLPPDEAIAIAKQVIDALEYAHEHGVIHRDLKPANIKVTPDGVVKVLDFGLAKALDQRAATSLDPENSPTLTMGATQAGVIMGTAAYMSPEQAVGKAADRRSDIFSFGVVLYEMLTGKRPFRGDSMGDTLASVVKDTPDWSALPAGTPSHLRKMLERMLVKDRKERLQAIGEARIVLSRDREGAVGAEESRPTPPSRSRLSRVLPWAIATFVLLALFPVNVLHYLETPAPQRALNATLLPPENAEFDFSLTYALPAISPDGTRIVFGARQKGGRQQLWLRRLDSATAQPLPGTEGAALPFWSPDSRWVGFGQDTKLKKIDIQGGPPVPVTDLPSTFRGGSWNSEGVIVFAGNATGPLMRVAASGGTAVAASAGQSHRYPWFLPDGRHFLYITSQPGDMPVQVGSLDEPGKAGKVVAQAHSPAVYAQGHLLFLRENTLMAQPFDAARLETTGEAMPVAEGVPTFGAPTRLAGFAVSPAGLLTFLSGTTAGQTQLLWKDRSGKVVGNLGERIGTTGNIAISPDQKSVAVGFGSPQDLWIYDAARGLPTRFTFDPANDREPVWSPEGKTLYFASARGKGNHNVYRKASNGTGAEELLLEDAVDKTPASFSPDGRLLLYSRTDPKTGNDIWVLPITPATGGAKPEPRVFLQTPFSEGRPQFSPDGQWVVYQSNESGQNEVYAAPFPGPGGKRQISSGGGTKPRWRKDGKEIFYHTEDGQLMAAEVLARNGTLEVGKLQKLFDGIVTPRGYLYDVSADGQRFLVADEGSATARPLTLLQNWTAALRK